MGGYITKKFFKNVNCPICLATFLNKNIESHDPRALQFVAEKSYDKINSGLIVPSVPLTNLLSDIANLTDNIGEKNYHQVGIVKNYVKIISGWPLLHSHHFAYSNSCLNYVLSACQHFIKVKIHHTLKKMKIMQNKAGNSRNRKVLKLTHQ
jgi:hypothetical protein